MSETLQRPWDASTAVPRERTGMSRKPEMMDVWVGSRLRHRRLSLGLSLDRLAQVIGVSRQQAEKWERGTTRMVAGRLYSVASALGVHPGFFFDGHDGLPVETSMATELREVATPAGVQMLTTYNRLLPEQRAAVNVIIDCMERANLAERTLGKDGADLMQETGDDC